MGKDASKRQDAQSVPHYAGAGLVVGAGVGTIFGLMYLEVLALGFAFGAAVGLVMGAAIDAYGRGELDSGV